MADDQAADNLVITIKFLVDKERSRVVLAEADNDFVDILFSFLTLPLGTIVRLLGKNSGLGCIDELYENIENLDQKSFQTEACKTMLLYPRSAAAARCEDLIINIDDTEPGPRKVYACRKPECCSKATCLASSVQNARCPHCCETMDSTKIWSKKMEDADGLFVKVGAKFIISDDLLVMPASMKNIFSFLLKKGVNDVSVLEERTMDLNQGEILTLLRRSLVSSVPLTDLFFHDMATPHDALSKFKGMARVKTECSMEKESKSTSVELFIDEANNKVSFVEAGEEFMNLLFSFLTFPLGSVVKLLDKNVPIGSVANLYTSVKNLGSECFKSEECKNMLISPKLGPFCANGGNMIIIDEISPNEYSADGCLTCYWKNKGHCEDEEGCVHGVRDAVFKELNPKSPVGGTEPGGGFVKGPNSFLVNDSMCLSPISIASAFGTIKSLGCPFNDLKTRNGSIGEVQALNLLKAVLISKTPLSDVFAAGE